MVNFGQLTAEIGWRVWGIPTNFNGFRVLAALLLRHRSLEANQTLHDVWPSPGLSTLNIHRVSKSVPPLACYNFDTHEWIFIFLAEMLPIK